jgi:pyrimidine-specific ribonucleoside hydrolase
MNKIPIIIDCDPGHDDAIMLMLAFGCGLFDVKAVTVSAGNQTQDKTLANVLKVLTLIGHQTRVFRGAEKPMRNELLIAGDIHGKTGLDGPDLPVPELGPDNKTAVEGLAEILQASPEKIIVVVTGPETNIAQFIQTYPNLKGRVEKIVLMGGGFGRGNITPRAEFNIYVDPEAASIVFNAGIPIVMCGLDVTHKALVFEDDIRHFRSIGNRTGKVVAELLDFFSQYYRKNRPELNGGVALHDPCTIAWMIDPSIFQSKPCHVAIELKGEFTRGETVVDFYDALKLPPNAEVLYDIDRKAFIQLISNAIAKLD